MAADPRQAGAELSGLERRRAEVVNGQMSVHELRAHLLEMCAMCQEIMMDSDEGPSREEVLARLDYRIAHLRRAR